MFNIILGERARIKESHNHIGNRGYLELKYLMFIERYKSFCVLLLSALHKVVVWLICHLDKILDLSAK